MKKLMVAVASAMAFGFAAFAEVTPWFDGGIATGWPTQGEGLTGGSWTSIGESVFENDAVTVDADEDTPLTFTATEPKTIGDVTKNVEFTTQITFTPFAKDALPDVPDEAKAGAIVVKDGDALSYYVLAKDGEANNWTNTEITAAAESTLVKVLLANDGKATYTFGEATPFVVDIINAGSVSAANYSGDGYVAKLSATYEANLVEFGFACPDGVEVYSVTNLSGVLEAPYKALKGSDVWVTYKTTNPAKLFANGTQYSTKKVEAAEGTYPASTCDEEIKDATIDINGTKFYLTFADAKKAIQTGDTVKFLGNATLTADESNMFIADLDYTLDFGGNLITLTEEFNFGKLKTGNVVLTNGTIQLAADYAMMIRLYGASVTLADVTVDAAHLIVNTTKSPDAYAGAIIATTGDVTLKGNTSVINVPAGLNGLAFNNYADAKAYTLGTLDLTELTGTISGNVFITGGTVVGAKAEMFEGDVNVGAGGNSYLTSLEGSGFVALAGEFATATTASAYLTNVTGKAYCTVADAFANATAKVTIADDCEVAARINIDPAKDITLDANGKTVTIGAGVYAFVYGGGDTAGEGTFTVTGNGTFYAPTADATCFLWARRGNVVVENGSFSMDGSAQCVYVNNGCTATINGGTFVNRTGVDVLNVANGETVTQIQCYGGSYSKDPATGDDVLKGSFVAAGYFSEANDELFTVYSQAVAEAKIGDKFFTTLAKAFAAAADDDTIVLQKDCEVAAKISIDPTKDITLDANGKTVTIGAGVYAFVNGGAVETTGTGTFTVTGNGTFYAPTADATCFLWARRGNVVVENGSFSMDGSAQCVYVNNGCTATINGGTFVNRTGVDVLNVANGETVTQIQCYGGSYSKDPATGDDVLGGSFLASHYWSKLNAETSLYDVKAMLKYYATVYADGQPYTWAGLGTGDAYYAEGVTVDALTAGVTNIGGQVYYVSKLLRLNDTVCEFEYDGTTLTKKEGATLDVTIDGTALSYKVTTGAPYTLDSLGHACIGGVYYTKYEAPSGPSIPEEQGTVDVDAQGNVTVHPLNDTVTEIELSNVSADATVIVPLSVERVKGVEDYQLEVTYTPTEAGSKTYYITEAFDFYGDATSGVTYELNPDGSVEIGEETIPVTPAATADAETPIADGAVATKTIPGLSYQLIRCTDLSAATPEFSPIGTPEVATGTTMTLTDADKPETKAFYKIQVTK